MSIKSFFLLAPLMACTPFVTNRGFDDLRDISKSIKVGSDTKETVRQKMSTPHSTSFDDNEKTWYYVYKKQETRGPFAPKAKVNQLLKIEFDAKGRVAKVDFNDKLPVSQIKIVKDKTHTYGSKSNYVSEILANVGRFTDDSKPKD